MLAESNMMEDIPEEDHILKKGRGRTITDHHHYNSKLTYYSDGSLQFSPVLSMLRYYHVAKIIKGFIIKGVQITKVVDAGCGNNTFYMKHLQSMRGLQEVVCVDKDLGLLVKERKLWQSADDRRHKDLHVQLLEADFLTLPPPLRCPHALSLIEVIEHIEVSDLPRLTWCIFAAMRPKLVIITTPNSDFNIDFPIKDGVKFRHDDHKFEWSSAEMRRYCEGVVALFPEYVFEIDGLGLGLNLRHCTQIAIFAKKDLSINKKIGKAHPDNIIKRIWNRYDENKLEIKQNKTKTRKKKSEKKKSNQKIVLTENEENIKLVLEEVRRLQEKPEELLSKASSNDEENGTKSCNKKSPPVERSAAQCDTVSSRVTSRTAASEGSLNINPSFPNDNFNGPFVLIQDITYFNEKTLVINELKYRIVAFVFCIDPSNEFYQFTNKIRKLNYDWYNKFDSLKSKDENSKSNAQKKTDRSANNSKSVTDNIQPKPAYTDCDDGACEESHRNYEYYCDECAFVYIKKVRLCTSPEHCMSDVQQEHQHHDHIVYESTDGTKVWFSLQLLQRHLGFLDQDKIRCAMKDYYTLVVLPGSRLEYYCSRVGKDDSWRSSSDVSDIEGNNCDIQSCDLLQSGMSSGDTLVQHSSDLSLKTTRKSGSDSSCSDDWCCSAPCNVLSSTDVDTDTTLKSRKEHFAEGGVTEQYAGILCERNRLKNGADSVSDERTQLESRIKQSGEVIERRFSDLTIKSNLGKACIENCGMEIVPPPPPHWDECD